jgi:hypothetical protein
MVILNAVCYVSQCQLSQIEATLQKYVFDWKGDKPLDSTGYPGTGREASNGPTRIKLDPFLSELGLVDNDMK